MWNKAFKRIIRTITLAAEGVAPLTNQLTDYPKTSEKQALDIQC